MAMSASARRRARRAWALIAAVIAIIALAVTVVVFWDSNDSGDNPMNGSATTTTTSAPAPTPQPADLVSCVKVEFDRNVDFNVVSKVTDVGYAINNRNEDLAAMKKDPRNLAFRAWQMTLWPDHSQWQSLVSGNCLSKQGVDLYNRVFNVLMGRDNTIKLVSMDENAQAPANYTNSGMDNGVAVINAESGIKGDRAAIKYSIQLAGGSAPMDLYVLKRCGNPTFASRPPLPVRHISTPPPRGTGTPPRRTPPPPTRTSPPPPPPPTTTQPPPPCNQPCCEGPCEDDDKIPSEGSDPQGNAGPGSGQNEDSGPGEELPVTHAPTTTRVDPPPPAPAPGQDGGTSTTVQAPPPAPDVAPTPGQQGSEDGAVAGPSEGEEEFTPDW